MRKNNEKRRGGRGENETGEEEVEEDEKPAE